MFELFHAIGDAGSAEVRKYIVDHDLLQHFRFRNVTYDEVKKDLLDRGGQRAPALWDGTTLLTEVSAILEKVKSLQST